jgi:hypothetical protein
MLDVLDTRFQIVDRTMKIIDLDSPERTAVAARGGREVA